MIALTKLAETSSKITFGWTPVSDCIGYVFYADEKRVSNTWDPAKSQITFSKVQSGRYRVDAVGVEDSGSWPQVTPVPSPSGVPMPVGDIPGWRQIFTDDFLTDVPLGGFSGCNAGDAAWQAGTAHCPGTSQAVRDKWTAYNDGWIENGHLEGFTGWYYPSKVNSIANGMLDFWFHTENGQHLVSALVPKVNGPNAYPIGRLYGRYVVRYRVDAMPGYKCSFLLWPDSEVWPRDGEIDFPEANFDGNIFAFMHRQDGTSGGDQDGYDSGVLQPGPWHTATIEWLPNRCTFILDGVTIGNSTSRIPNTPMHWVLQTGTRGDGTSDQTQGHMQVDWVAVYAPA